MSHLRLNHYNTMLTCECGSCSISTHIWNTMTEHSQQAVEIVARNCPTCKKREQEKRAKRKLFSVDVAIYATAYVQAQDPEEAKRLLEESFIQTSLEMQEDGLINGDRYEDIMSNPSLVITLSPTMTANHILHEPEQVWPET